jgi:hypothetical protein
MTIDNRQGIIHICAIKPNSLVANEGSVRADDEILSVNGNEVTGKTVDEVAKMIGKTEGPLLLDITHNPVMVSREEDEVSPHAPCPYYLSRNLAKHAELVFAPYNYVLDPFIRERLDINLEGSVVVLDEARKSNSVIE